MTGTSQPKLLLSVKRKTQYVVHKPGCGATNWWGTMVCFAPNRAISLLFSTVFPHCTLFLTPKIRPVKQIINTLKQTTCHSSAFAAVDKNLRKHLMINIIQLKPFLPNNRSLLIDFFGWIYLDSLGFVGVSRLFAPDKTAPATLTRGSRRERL